ncbi:MAG: rubrerythrin family protein [Bacteroidales bacterium]|nr:rubrerythrin family protein [Bacteroidales bacterium]
MGTTKSLHGTATERAIVDAYMSESAAYTRYTFYAQQADKELYYPVGQIFRDTADNELHHSKVFFRMLQGGTAPCQLTVDAGIIGDTASNLETAAHEELTEGVEQYTQAAATARSEGFDDIAAHFEAIAKIENHHRERFLKLLGMVKAGTLWKRETPIEWQCLVCGYVYTGLTPPEVCPACDHPYQHYMPKDIWI